MSPPFFKMAQGKTKGSMRYKKIDEMRLKNTYVVGYNKTKAYLLKNSWKRQMRR